MQIELFSFYHSVHIHKRPQRCANFSTDEKSLTFHHVY